MPWETYTSRLFFVLALWLCVFAANAGVDKTSGRSVVVRGQLGSGPDEVGARIENNYDVLPQSIAVTADGNVFIADHVNDKIVVYTSSGRWLTTIPLPVKGEHSGVLTINDMTTDSHGNLYVASRFAMVINKYGQTGQLLRSIGLEKKDICWSMQKGWIPCGIQIGRIIAAPDGSIFLRGWDELIKLAGSGDVLQKWMLEAGEMFVIDQHANVYMAKPDLTVVSYNSAGKLLWKRKCGVTLSHVKDGHCQLPAWIDRKGNLYWFENHGTRVIKTDLSGREQGRIDFGTFQLVGNTVKFDSEGDLFFLNSTKTEFWIERARVP